MKWEWSTLPARIYLRDGSRREFIFLNNIIKMVMDNGKLIIKDVNGEIHERNIDDEVEIKLIKSMGHDI